MRTIYKYELHAGSGGVKMPRGAEVVEVGTQEGVVTLWALVDTDAPTETRHFGVLGTGHELQSNETYVGTFFAAPFVWHVVEATQ